MQICSLEFGAYREVEAFCSPFQAAAAFAADAVARMSGTVGVVAVTAGPGLTNTVTAIKNAQMAQSPVLLLGKRQQAFFHHLPMQDFLL